MRGFVRKGERERERPMEDNRGGKRERGIEKGQGRRTAEGDWRLGI